MFWRPLFTRVRLIIHSLDKRWKSGYKKGFITKNLNASVEVHVFDICRNFRSDFWRRFSRFFRFSILCHAASGNGLYDTYCNVANAPLALRQPPPVSNTSPISMQQVMNTLPDQDTSATQAAVFFTLSKYKKVVKTAWVIFQKLNTQTIFFKHIFKFRFASGCLVKKNVHPR